MPDESTTGAVYERTTAEDHVELRFFTDDPMKITLCREYWELDGEGGYQYPVKVLAARFDISPSRVSQAVSALCEARSSNLTCETCGKGFVVTSRQNLTDIARSSWRRDTECQSCQESRQRARVAAQEHLANHRRLFLEDEFAIREEPSIMLDEVTLTEALSLFALIRSPEHFSTDALPPLSKREEVFAPGVDFGIDLIKALYHRGLIAIHPETSSDAFAWEEDRFKGYYPDRTSWVVRGRGTPEERTLELEQRLAKAFRESDWPDSWHEQWLDCWMEIAIKECIAHIQFCLAEHDFPFAAGPKTRGTYTDLLETFSVGQVFNFNWRAAKDVASYWLRENVGKHQAANSCVGNIQRQADRARAGSWEVKPFSRPWQMPLATVSHIFFTVIMKVPNMMTEVLPHH
jgi:hypothetical protein